jgi:hypothetical protein
VLVLLLVHLNIGTRRINGSLPSILLLSRKLLLAVGNFDDDFVGFADYDQNDCVVHWSCAIGPSHYHAKNSSKNSMAHVQRATYLGYQKMDKHLMEIHSFAHLVHQVARVIVVQWDIHLEWQ